jgi:hypothetical protein
MIKFKFLDSPDRYKTSLTALVHFVDVNGNVMCKNILWGYMKDINAKRINREIETYDLITFRGKMFKFFELYEKLMASNNGYLCLAELHSIEFIGRATYVNSTTRQMPFFTDDVEIKYRKYVQGV